MLVFAEGGKQETPGQKPSEHSESQLQNQPTYDTVLEPSPGHTGERRELSPLHPKSYSEKAYQRVCL